MASASNEDLLARLAGHGGGLAGGDPWAAIAASQPRHESVEGRRASRVQEETVAQLMTQPRQTAAAKTAVGPQDGDVFIPYEPASLLEAQLTPSSVEALILKLLLSRGDTSGRQVSDHIKLPFRIIEDLLRQIKSDQLVVHKGSAPMNDYVYQLTDIGRERSRRLADHCTYF
jgi:hypothetical protein